VPQYLTSIHGHKDYSQKENRITASIIGCFKKLSFSLMEQILQTLIGEQGSHLLTFSDQPYSEWARPDARIRASFSYWIETKIVLNALTKDQLQRHLTALNKEQNIEIQRLLILTPDNVEPEAIKKVNDKRIVWANFDVLVNSIKDALDNDALFSEDEWFTSYKHIPTERERELLIELVQFLNSISPPLIRSEEQVIVVAARIALEEYQKLNAYMTLANRTFQPSSYLAFYTNNRIFKYVPVIQKIINNVILSGEAITKRKELTEDFRARLIKLMNEIEYYRKERLNQEMKVFLLSAPNDEQTLKLDYDIENDLRSRISGRPIPFTYGQRYVQLSKLIKRPTPRTTSELIK
jgi:hypothetical protein